MHAEDRAGRSLRFSVGRFNSEADIDQAIDIVPKVIAKLRTLSAPVLQRVTA
jgi:cysteine sulfinate desulfinase/cysteine desulfurase-like protein